jgi:hypothetical protein
LESDLKQGISYLERETEIEGKDREIDGRNRKRETEIKGTDREIDGRNRQIEGRD